MSTINLQLTNAWQQIALDTDGEVHASWSYPVHVEVALTATNVAPTVSGHHFAREQGIDRDNLSAGFIWAKLIDGAPVTAIPFKVSIGGSQTAPLNANSGAFAASLVVRNARGRLFGVSGYNSKASSQFIQVHDTAALPADGVAPVIVIPVAANSPFSIDFGVKGRAFVNGIVVCNSSTAPTKTIGAADCWIDAQHNI